MKPRMRFLGHRCQVAPRVGAWIETVMHVGSFMFAFTAA